MADDYSDYGTTTTFDTPSTYDDQSLYTPIDTSQAVAQGQANDQLAQSNINAIDSAPTAATSRNPSQGSVGGALSKALSGLGLGGGNTSNTAALQAAVGLLSAYGQYKQNKANTGKLPPLPAMGALPALPGGSSAGYGPAGGYNFANYQGGNGAGMGYAPRAQAPAAPAPSYFTYGSGPEHQFFQQVTGKGGPIAPVTMANGGAVPAFDMGGMVPNMGMTAPMSGVPQMPGSTGAIAGQPDGHAFAPPVQRPPMPQGAPPPPVGAPQPQRPSTMMSRMQQAKPFAKGGPSMPHGALSAAMNPGVSRHVTGPGDGTSDSIPARLANGEYVFDSQAVSMIGNGDNSAGAKKLDEFRKNLRAHKGAALAKGKMAPDAKPLHKYMGGQ